MKRIICISLITFISVFASAQTYKVGVMSAMGRAIQYNLQIVINDSLVTLTDSDAKQAKFQFVKEANGTVYFTDGVMTHFFTILDVKGKIKGFNYDKYILFTPDNRRGTGSVIYYAVQDNSNKIEPKRK